MTSYFSAEGGLIWIKFRWLVQNDMSIAAIWSKSKPDAEFKYGGRLGEFNGMLSQSHLPHCRVLPPGKFNVMIPELRVTSHGAATGWIQWHVIPEPHITLQDAATWWIRCHDSRATCYIAGCKNSIRHIENRFSPFFLFFSAVWALTSGGFLVVSDTLVIVTFASDLPLRTIKCCSICCLRRNVEDYCHKHFVVVSREKYKLMPVTSD